MTRFAANLSMLFTQRPFLERFGAAAGAGFDAVEFWWPTQALEAGVTTDDIVARAHELRLDVVLLNFDAGDMPAGDRGLAGDPNRSQKFRDNVPMAVDLARKLGCLKLNALAGNIVAGSDRSEQLALLADNVRFAADVAARENMAIMLEALNVADTPAYLLPNVDSVLALIERVGRPNVRFQLDTYHVARGGDDVLASIARARGVIGHVQFADYPGRHEPGTGQLPFRAILRDLAAAGYADAVGLEFAPTNPAAPDFSFLAELRSQTRLSVGPDIPAALPRSNRHG
jgi:hydroxypyruvate isomerase